jgi:D-glycero-D-manno-heptose 1,7-bisphosphate phosphatase
MLRKAKLIWVDRLSGTGKDTQISFIKTFFEDKGFKPKLVREPDFLRERIYAYKEMPPEVRDVEVEAMLFVADRRHLVNTEISPTMQKEGVVILSNRSYLSHCVYQTMQGMDLERILEMNSFYPDPDLALVLLCDPETAVKRIEERAKETGKEITVDEEVEKITRLKQGYESLSEKLPHLNIKYVNADGSKPATFYQTRSHLNNLLGVPMEKAIFLDKDGTLVDNSGYPDVIPSDDIYFDRTVTGLRALQDAGFKLILISSQPWVARERMTIPEVDDVFKSVVSKYAEQGITIDDFYYCPHHRSDGCECKKPNTGLLEQAVDKFSIDTSRSYFVGDMEGDIITGRNFGLKTCLVRTGNGKDYDSNVQPDYDAADVNRFAQAILE